MSTGEFSVAGGYSTADGFLGEVSIGERNLLGLGLYAKASVQYGQHASGCQLSFVEPYLLGYRLALGPRRLPSTQKATNFVSYDTRTTGGATRLGFALREDLSLQLRYSIYSQKVESAVDLAELQQHQSGLRQHLPDAGRVECVAGANTRPHRSRQPRQTDCFADGEASLAVRRELAQGSVLTSLVGYDLTYNTLDNNRNPTSGTLAVLKQDFAGVGGDVQFVRTTADVRTYYELMPDVVGVLHLQGGQHLRLGCEGPGDGTNLRMLDHFQMGPQLVRGFAPAGIGPRDLTLYNFNGTPGDALGGTMYWGASVEFQTPLFFAAQGNRHQARGLRRCRLAVELRRADYRGCRRCRARPAKVTTSLTRVNAATTCSSTRRSAWACCGRRRSDRCGSILAYPDHEAAIRPEAVVPLQRRDLVLIAAGRSRHG